MTPYYEHGGITIYHGDCLEILPHLGVFDAVLTDPPYGVGAAEWDRVDWSWSEQISDHMTDGGHLFSFWSVQHLRSFRDIAGLQYERVLVWSKPMTRSNRRGNATWHWEPIFWFRKHKAQLARCVSDVLTENPPIFRRHPENCNHPCQKPLGITRRLIGMAGAASVLDPFVGSGTTVCAARQMGLTAVGIEREERYCEIAAKRLAQDMLPLAAEA